MTTQTTTHTTAETELDLNLPPVEQPAVDVAALAAEHAQLGARIADAKERQEEIVELLRAALEYGTHPAGAMTVAVQHNRRPDTKRLEAEYPQRDFPLLYKSSLDMTGVRKFLPPVVVDAYQIEGPAKVIVK
jgi:hypothetical protein